MTGDFTARVAAALGDAYRIERELGGGGMSRVFVAEEVALGRKVVVKVLPPEMGAGLNAERFRREIQLAASLQHPHVVPLHAAGRKDEIVWYTMPLIEGESLRARLAREGELPVGEVVRILGDVADSLAYAHAHGVVHRDIKPDNVLLSGRHAVVTDFGVAKALSSATGESSLTSVGVALGTPAYMAPEQAAADPHVDHRADIYALGAMAYEMLTGRPPFSGTPQMVLAAHVTQAPEAVTARRPSVPPALASLVMRCLEKKAADRHQTAAELHQQFELMATPSGGMAPTAATSAVARAASGEAAPSADARLLTPARAGGLAAVAVAAVLLVWSPWSTRSGDLPLDANVVGVLPFRVAGADPALQYLREGMMDLLHAKLTGEGGPRAADVQSVVAAVRDAGGADSDLSEDALSQVARRVGAGLLLQGSIVGPADRFVLSASLVSMPSGRTVAQTSVNGSRDSIFVVVDELARRLLALGAGATEGQLGVLTTTSSEALRAYLDGQAAYRRGAYPEATRQLERAVDLDTGFVLAASALVESAGWFSWPTTDVTRAQRLAWSQRDRLHATDRQFLSIRLGSRYPASTPWTERIEDRSRLTQVLPESPLAWYYLGDAYFHFGAAAGFSDAMERAARAFEDAIRRDSLYAPPLDHLARIAQIEGDTKTQLRTGSLRLALDSTSVTSQQLRVAMGSARSDPEEHRRAEAILLDSLSVGAAFGMALWFWGEPFVVERASEMSRRAHARAQDASETIQSFALRAGIAYLQGREREARAYVDSLWRSPLSLPIADRSAAVFATASAATADPATIAAARDGLPASAEPSVADLFLRIRAGELGDAENIVRRLRAQPLRGLEGLNVPEVPHLLLVAEAAIAQARGAPDARQRLAIADTGLAGRHLFGEWSVLLADLFDRAGEPEAALRALDRVMLPLGEPPPARGTERLLLEGRLAERVGDRSRAIAAYRQYLMWRTEPDPEFVPERDRVRAELARLEALR